MIADTSATAGMPLSAKAVIHDQRGRVLLQKRDNNPAIMEPGCWGLFGGQVESGESLDVALARELREELSSSVGRVKGELFRASRGTYGIVNVVFLMECAAPDESFELKEGQAYGWFALDELVELPLSVLVFRHLSHLLRALAPIDTGVEARLEQALLRHCRLHKKNDRVYYASSTPAALNMQSMFLIKELAAYRELPMARVCLHHSDEEPIHEMLMLHTRPQSVGPLKQDKSSLSYHMLDGTADFRLHDNQGARIWESRLDSENNFCSRSLRLDARVFRSMQTVSPYAIFLEVAGGPFKDNDTVWLNAKN
jgi:8-oxo-dGTP diphosphatase